MPPKAHFNWGAIRQSCLLISSTRSMTPFLQSTAHLPKLSYTPVRTIKSTFAPKPDRFAFHPKKPALESTVTKANERKFAVTPLRTGALAIKKGMTSIINPETGRRMACTVLQLDRNEVISYKTREIHGYYAVQVGAGFKTADNTTKPMLGHFAAAQVSPKRWVTEFKVQGKEGLQVGIGETIPANWFREGQYVDVQGVSRGMGFEGGMKRHGFGGQPASHGQSLMHRGMGSAGGSQGSGSRVLPGKRMPGNMGNQNVTVKSLKILKVDADNGIICVNGCVPGPKSRIIRVQDARAKTWPKGPMNLNELSGAAEAADETATA